jgi:serine/threonine protein kinase
MIQFKKTPITNDYRFEELMGKGASADVYKAVSISGEFHTAIKKIKRRANNEKLAAEFMN